MRSPRSRSRWPVAGPEDPACVPDGAGGCSLCGDEGLVGTVVEVDAAGATARVRLDGEPGEPPETEAALDLVDGVTPGDRVVVHMGFAIATVREEAS